MISSLTGSVQSVEAQTVTFDVNGVGYEVVCTSACVAKLTLESSSTSQLLLVYTDIKEDSIRLYGFADRLEKQIFMLLLRVNGVGAKTACDLLSRVDKRDLLRFVSEGNLGQLQKIKGIGKKTAERIVVELKDIMLQYSREQSDFVQPGPAAPGRLLSEAEGREDEALQALVALGLQARDAQAMLSRALEELPELRQAPTAEIIKSALKYI